MRRQSRNLHGVLVGKVYFMRRTLILAGILTAALALRTAIAQQKTAPERLPAKPGVALDARPTEQARQEDEKAIRDVAEAFLQAYNAKNAKSLAALFVSTGEIVSEAGKSFQGRVAIEREFATIFQEHPKAKIQVVVQSIRFVGPTLAIEDGLTTVTEVGNQPIERSRYMVVQVKQDGKWRMASARDFADEAALPAEELRQLEWLIGEWVDESPDALVITSYRWDIKHDAILSNFSVQVHGQSVTSGTQRIAWDPQAKKLHSWVFDTAGGFSEGIWSRTGNQWLIKMTGVTADGHAASATNTITRVAKDRATWQSRDRVIGDKTEQDIEKVPLVRKPPMPQAANGASKPSAGESK